MEVEERVEAAEEDLIPVYIMGKCYMVPPSQTIMKAIPVSVFS